MRMLPFDRLLPRDLIAILALCIGTLLIMTSHDGIVGAVMLAVISHYFGKETLIKTLGISRNEKDSYKVD